MKKLTLKTVLVLVITLVVVVGIAFLLRILNQKLTRESFPLKYDEIIEAASQKYGVDKALILGVIKTESDFDPNAKSSAGAIGLMQVMEDTFVWMQTYYKDDTYKFDDLYDPAVNIDYGTEVLSVLLKKYDGCEDTAVAAYNGGAGNVDKWLKDPQYSDDGKTLKSVPFPETDNYRRKVARNKSIYTQLYFS